MSDTAIHPLEDIAQKMRTQKNMATSHPMFLVQRKRRIYGFDPDYCDNVAWLNGPNDYCEATPEEHAQLEAQYEEDGNEPEDWQRTGYRDEWEFVTACLTEDGAKAYLVRNGHNIKGETRIYADSCYRNEEMIRVREYLLALGVAV